MLKSLGRANRVLMLALFVFALSDGLWFNLRQLYLADLGATASQVGLALSAASLAGAMVPIPAGYLSDRCGPKTVILLPWAMAAIGTLVMSVAPSWRLATVGLVVYTLCVGANPALVSFVLHNLPSAGTAMSSELALTTVFGVYPLTLVAAPAIGGAIASRAGLRTALVLAALGFGLAVLILSTARSRGTTLHGTAHDGHTLDRNRGFLVLVAYFTVALVTLYVGYVLVPNYLQQVRGYTESLVGVLFSVLYMGTVAYNALTGRVSPRVGFAAVLLGPWLAMLVLWQIPSLPATCVAFALLGGISTTWPLMQASIDRVVEPDKRGMALGVIEMCTRLGAAAASATAGQLYDLSPKHDLPFQLAVAAIPLVLLIWLLLPKRYLTHDDTPMP